MTKLAYLYAVTALLSSSAVTASSAEEAINSDVDAPAQSQIKLSNQVDPFSDCCDYRRRQPCLIPMSEQVIVSDDELQQRLTRTLAADPIYVGGARYQLNNDNMREIYSFEPIYGPCPDHPPKYYNVLKGYEAYLPVDGDFGQDLIYEVTGRANVPVSLSVSCGTGESAFTLNDRGTKLLISKRLNSNGSCKKMHIKAFGSRIAPSSLALTVAVYTPLQ